MQKGSVKGRLCPYLQNPCDECYCNSMNSHDIEKVVSFCITGFRMCDVYKSHEYAGDPVAT